MPAKRVTGKPTGRPSAWTYKIQPKLSVITALKHRGHTDKEIAKELGIGYRTLMENKSRYPQLVEALNKGRKQLTLELENSLYRKALGGFKVKKIVKKYVKVNGKVVNNTYEIQETITEQAPDLGSLIFALKNLDPDRWNDRIDKNNNVEELTKAFKDFLGGMKDGS